MQGNSRHRPSRPEQAGGSPQRRVGEARPVSARALDQEHLTRVVGPVVGAAGLDLESLRARGVGRRVLVRVVVDSDGGVALDDIASLSRDLSAALDSDGALDDLAYTLEVSSPGIDRPLTEPRHWRRAVGRLVRVPVAAGPDPVEGRVVAATADGVTLDLAGSRQDYRYGDLGPGRVQVEFGHMEPEPGGSDGGEPDGH